MTTSFPIMTLARRYAVPLNIAYSFSRAVKREAVFYSDERSDKAATQWEWEAIFWLSDNWFATKPFREAVIALHRTGPPATEPPADQSTKVSTADRDAVQAIVEQAATDELSEAFGPFEGPARRCRVDLSKSVRTLAEKHEAGFVDLSKAFAETAVASAPEATFHGKPEIS